MDGNAGGGRYEAGGLVGAPQDVCFGLVHELGEPADRRPQLVGHFAPVGSTKAEQLVRNLARRLEKDWPGISVTILEGLDEILCVVRLGLPEALRRSLACTNIIENMNGTIRQVTHNVRRWQDASMALRWTCTAPRL